jgi:hypothetical protein
MRGGLSTSMQRCQSLVFGACTATAFKRPFAIGPLRGTFSLNRGFVYRDRARREGAESRNITRVRRWPPLALSPLRFRSDGFLGVLLLALAALVDCFPVDRDGSRDADAYAHLTPLPPGQLA